MNQSPGSYGSLSNLLYSGGGGRSGGSGNRSGFGLQEIDKSCSGHSNSALSRSLESLSSLSSLSIGSNAASRIPASNLQGRTTGSSSRESLPGMACADVTHGVVSGGSSSSSSSSAAGGKGVNRLTRKNLVDQLRDYQARRRNDWATQAFFSATSGDGRKRGSPLAPSRPPAFWLLFFFSILLLFAASLVLSHVESTFFKLGLVALILFVFYRSVVVPLCRPIQRRHYAALLPQ